MRALITKALHLTILWIACHFVTAAQGHSIIRVSPEGATFGPAEVSVAINPLRPDNIIATSLTRLGTSVAYVSDDGGMSWSLVSNVNTARLFQADDAVTFDSNGHAYHSYIAYFGVGETGAARQSNGIFVTASRNDGASWETPVAVVEHPDSVTPFEDKPYISADTNPQSPFLGNLYVAWTRFDDYESSDPDCQSHIYLSRSSDGGQTFSPPQRVSDIPGDCADSDGTVVGAVPAAGAQGELYLVWSGPDGLVFDRSLDGGASFGVDRSVTATPGGWDLPIPGLARHYGLPVTAVDLSDGPQRGTLYVNWIDERHSDTDVFVIRSTDGGETWSNIVRVNDDPLANGRSQFFSWMAVDPLDGSVNVIFYDRRDTQGTASGLTFARSVDGGESFVNYPLDLPSFQCSSGLFFGDYLGIAARAGQVVPVFTHCPTSQQLAISAALFSFDPSTAPSVMPLESPSAFNSQKALLFDFEGFHSGSAPSSILSRWGIRFTAPADSEFGFGISSGMLGLNFDTFLQLHPQADSLLDSPFVIDFERPLKRVGFDLEAVGPLTEAVFFDGAGNELGRFDSLTPGGFFGVESLDPEVGIFKISLQSHQATLLQVDNLRVEFAAPPSFQACLAQIGNGLAADFRLTTAIAVSNPWNFPVEGSLAFYDSQGEALPLEAAGLSASEFPLHLPPAGTYSLQTGGDQLAVGWACLHASAPLEASATFQLLSLQGEILAEAGIGSAAAQQRSVAHVVQSAETGLGSGLAVANPSQVPVFVSLGLLQEEPLSDLTYAVELPPHGQTALFLDEIFPHIEQASIEGPLLIRASSPVVIAVLRTRNGRVLSSLPVAGTSR